MRCITAALVVVECLWDAAGQA